MSDVCWHCGAAHEPQKPRRSDFDSEPDFLIASLEWLDYEFPARGRSGRAARVAAWRHLEAATARETTRARIVALIEVDAWTPAEAAEFDRLAVQWKALRAADTHSRKKEKST